MARVVGDRDAGGARKSGATTAQDAGVRDEAQFVPKVSGVFAKPAAPLREPHAVGDHSDVFEDPGPGEFERPVVIRTHRGSHVARLRQIAGHMVVLMVAVAAPDIAESLDRGESFTLEVSGADGAKAPRVLLRLIEIGARGAVLVAGKPIEVTHDPLILLQLLLEGSGGCPYAEVERKVWPAAKGDLTRCRHTLVHRLNEALEPPVHSVLERVAQPRPERRLVFCRAGLVRLALDPRIRVWVEM